MLLSSPSTFKKGSRHAEEQQKRKEANRGKASGEEGVYLVTSVQSMELNVRNETKNTIVLRPQPDYQSNFTNSAQEKLSSALRSREAAA